MSAGSPPPAERQLTERQRYWLKHLRAAARKAEPLAEYAEHHDLSVSSLYEAKRRLRHAGLLEAATAVKTPEQTAPSFVRLAVRKPSSMAELSSLRVRLGSGTVLEWSEAPQGEALRELLGMLA